MDVLQSLLRITPAGRLICYPTEVFPVIPYRLWFEVAVFTGLTRIFHIPILTCFLMLNRHLVHKQVVHLLVGKQDSLANYVGGPDDGRIFR